MGLWNGPCSAKYFPSVYEDAINGPAIPHHWDSWVTGCKEAKNKNTRDSGTSLETITKWILEKVLHSLWNMHYLILTSFIWARIPVTFLQREKPHLRAEVKWFSQDPTVHRWQTRTQTNILLNLNPMFFASSYNSISPFPKVVAKKSSQNFKVKIQQKFSMPATSLQQVTF